MSSEDNQDVNKLQTIFPRRTRWKKRVKYIDGLYKFS